jgi:ATP-dependent Clp protease ATP-binding subunit ClpC
MWQRFTEGTKHAIFRAQKAASDRSENIVKPEHLLIGLLSETDTIAYRLLQEAGIVVGDLVGHLEAILTPGPGRDGTDLRLDPAAKKAIDLAWNEARRLQRNYIGTEHLLLGVIAANSGATGITFRHFDLSLGNARHFIDAVEVWPPIPVAGVEGGLAIAAPQSAPAFEEPVDQRKTLLPGLLLGIVFALLVMMLRGCG